MTERYPGDGAVANGFGRRRLQEQEARLLYEAEYPAPPDMRVPGTWRLSAGGIPVPPVPEGAARRAEIARIRSSLTQAQRDEPRYAADSHTLWTMYFPRGADRRHQWRHPRGRFNADGRHEWWGVPGRTLEAVLDHIETGNVPCLEYPQRLSFSRRRGSSWTPRRMEPGSSSSSGSGSLAALRPVKPELEETPPGRRTSSALVINEGARPSPPGPAPGRRSLRLVRPKPEPRLLLVKPEHVEMAAPDDESALKWAKEDYVREQVRRQRRAYAELQAWRNIVAPGVTGGPTTGS